MLGYHVTGIILIGIRIFVKIFFGMAIGTRIKEYRLRKGYKVAQFASIIDISQGSLSDIENEKTKPSAETLSSIVRHTDINALWLLTGEGPMLRDEIIEKKLLDIKDIPKEQIKEWLDEFWIHATEDEKVWLKVQFPIAFPQYKEWLQKKQYMGDSEDANPESKRNTG